MLHVVPAKASQTLEIYLKFVFQKKSDHKNVARKYHKKEKKRIKFKRLTTTTTTKKL